MFVNLLKTPGRERLMVLAILVFGALARLIWALTNQSLKTLATESHNVAVSLARAGRFDDPFAIGGGPTAHIGMLTPLPSAAAYWLFGVDTKMAELSLVLWAIGVVSVSFWLVWRIACRLEAPPLARLAAVIFVSLTPLQFGLETREGRSWEVNLAAALLLWILLRLVVADREERLDARNLAITGLIAGFLIVVSPPAGLAAAAAIGMFQIMRLRVSQWWIAPTAFALVAGLFTGGWAVRNMSKLGEPIPLRDNFGLELALSNYSGAVHPTDADAAYVARKHDIHPIDLASGLDAMRAAGGEVAYYHELTRETESWITEHPVQFLKLNIRRFVQFFLPPRWFWGTFGGAGKIIWLRQGLVWAATLGGFCTLVIMAYRRRAYAYLLIAALTCSTPYIIIQPTLRYRYLVSSLLIFLAFDGIGRLVNEMRNRGNRLNGPAGV